MVKGSNPSTVYWMDIYYTFAVNIVMLVVTSQVIQKNRVGEEPLDLSV